MFWKKKTEPSEPKDKKLPGPKDIPEMVGGHLVTDFHRNPDWVWKLRAVLSQRQESKNTFDIRVYDEADVAAKKIKIHDYTSLDEHPDLILYEGWYDKESREVQLEEKKAA